MQICIYPYIHRYTIQYACKQSVHLFTGPLSSEEAHGAGECCASIQLGIVPHQDAFLEVMYFQEVCQRVEVLEKLLDSGKPKRQPQNPDPSGLSSKVRTLKMDKG